MRRLLISACVLMVVLVTAMASGQGDDYQYNLTPLYLYGTWSREYLIPSQRDPGVSFNKVIAYKIRELNAHERRVLSAITNNAVVKSPLLFIIWYDVGYIKGYIYDPVAIFDSLSTLKYSALVDYGEEYAEDVVTFKMPVAGHLIVQNSTEYFELIKRR